MAGNKEYVKKTLFSEDVYLEDQKVETYHIAKQVSSALQNPDFSPNRTFSMNCYPVQNNQPIVPYINNHGELFLFDQNSNSFNVSSTQQSQSNNISTYLGNTHEECAKPPIISYNHLDQHLKQMRAFRQKMDDFNDNIPIYPEVPANKYLYSKPSAHRQLTNTQTKTNPSICQSMEGSNDCHPENSLSCYNVSESNKNEKKKVEVFVNEMSDGSIKLKFDASQTVRFELCHDTQELSCTYPKSITNQSYRHINDIPKHNDQLQVRSPSVVINRSTKKEPNDYLKPSIRQSYANENSTLSTSRTITTGASGFVPYKRSKDEISNHTQTLKDPEIRLQHSSTPALVLNTVKKQEEGITECLGKDIQKPDFAKTYSNKGAIDSSYKESHSCLNQKDLVEYSCDKGPVQTVKEEFSRLPIQSSENKTNDFLSYKNNQSNEIRNTSATNIIDNLFQPISPVVENTSCHKSPVRIVEKESSRLPSQTSENKTNGFLSCKRLGSSNKMRNTSASNKIDKLFQPISTNAENSLSVKTPVHTVEKESCKLPTQTSENNTNGCLSYKNLSLSNEMRDTSASSNIDNFFQPISPVLENIPCDKNSVCTVEKESYKLPTQTYENKTNGFISCKRLGSSNKMSNTSALSNIDKLFQNVSSVVENTSSDYTPVHTVEIESYKLPTQTSENNTNGFLSYKRLGSSNEMRNTSASNYIDKLFQPISTVVENTLCDKNPVCTVEKESYKLPTETSENKTNGFLSYKKLSSSNEIKYTTASNNIDKLFQPISSVCEKEQSIRDVLAGAGNSTKVVVCSDMTNKDYRENGFDQQQLPLCMGLIENELNETNLDKNLEISVTKEPFIIQNSTVTETNNFLSCKKTSINQDSSETFESISTAFESEKSLINVIASGNKNIETESIFDIVEKDFDYKDINPLCSTVDAPLNLEDLKQFPSKLLCSTELYHISKNQDSLTKNIDIDTILLMESNMSSEKSLTSDEKIVILNNSPIRNENLNFEMIDFTEMDDENLYLSSSTLSNQKLKMVSNNKISNELIKEDNQFNVQRTEKETKGYEYEMESQCNKNLLNELFFLAQKEVSNSSIKISPRKNLMHSVALISEPIENKLESSYFTPLSTYSTEYPTASYSNYTENSPDLCSQTSTNCTETNVIFPNCNMVEIEVKTSPKDEGERLLQAKLKTKNLIHETTVNVTKNKPSTFACCVNDNIINSEDSNDKTIIAEKDLVGEPNASDSEDSDKKYKSSINNKTIKKTRKRRGQTHFTVSKRKKSLVPNYNMVEIKVKTSPKDKGERLLQGKLKIKNLILETTANVAKNIPSTSACCVNDNIINSEDSNDKTILAKEDPVVEQNASDSEDSDKKYKSSINNKTIKKTRKRRGPTNCTVSKRKKSLVFKESFNFNNLESIFQDLEKIKFTKQNFQRNVNKFVKLLINPEYSLDTVQLIFHVIQHLKHTSKNSLIITNKSRSAKVFYRDSSNPLPITEDCIVSAMIRIEEENSEFYSLLDSTVSTFYNIVLGKEFEFPLLGLVSLCRVLTEICKYKNNKLKLIQFCSELLKWQHQHAQYLIASIASIWSEVFQLSSSSDQEEIMFFSAFACGLQRKPDNLTDFEWQQCKTVFSEVLSVKATESKLIPRDVCFLFKRIRSKCLENIYDKEYLLSTPLVIYARIRGWEWARDVLLKPFIEPNLKKYSVYTPNDMAFEFLLNLYAEIRYQFPGKDQFGLLKDFFETEETGYLHFTAAIVILKLIIWKGDYFPDEILQWMQKWSGHSRVTAIQHLFQRRMMRDQQFSISDIITEIEKE